jgi:hypothetical protein
VLAPQREGRLGIVIERSSFPLRRIVAISASLPESSLMGVVDRVAVSAIRNSVLEFSCGVTDRAIDFDMSALERKLGAAVIEANLAPLILRVTLRAVFSKLAPMSIVLSVANDAATRRIATLLILRMTTRALGALMRTLQWIVGRIVIERLGVESHDVCPPPQVFTVTASAAAYRGRGLQPVNSRAGT